LSKISVSEKIFSWLKGFAKPTKPWSKSVFSQEGEELILQELLGEAAHGCYVDIGACDPWRFSNTAVFYNKGWRGLNVDPRPGFKTLFDQQRPKDLNIECAVGRRRKTTKLFLFDEPALNTVCKKRKVFLQKTTSYKIKDIVHVSSRTLASLLDEFRAQSIDFLSVDVEGLELEVLRSGNWKKHRPKFVVLEILDTQLKHLGKSPCIKFMQKKGYEVLTKGLRSVILKDKA
jgi:FkbM family methyltransferase